MTTSARTPLSTALFRDLGYLGCRDSDHCQIDRLGNLFDGSVGEDRLDDACVAVDGEHRACEAVFQEIME